MRKALTVFLVMLIIFTAVYTYSAFDIGEENDNVIFTETILSGDKSFAEGVTVETSYQYEHRLFWDSTLTLGKENEVQTEFTFNKDYTYEESIVSEGSINFYTESGYSISQSTEDFLKDIAELKGIAKAYKELYDTAVPNEMARKVIKYKDYLDYYPLNGACSANGEQIDIGAIYGIMEDKRSKEIQGKLEEYFKIPILEEECIKINLLKEDDGNIISMGSSQVSDGTDSYNFYSYSAEGPKGLYVVFSNRTYLGKIIDTSLIPGGYGVYFFPYGTSGIDFDNIQTVYTVDEENEIIDISTDKDKTNLHLITKEKDKIILNVIDIETMVCIQRLELHEDMKNDPEDYYFGVGVLETNKDFIVYEIYDFYSYLSVVTIDDSGKYKQVLKVKNDINVYDADFEWDGKYLYSAAYLDNNYGTISGNVHKILIAIFGKDGVKFNASYNTSLNTGENIDYRSDYYCNNNTYKPVISLS